MATGSPHEEDAARDPLVRARSLMEAFARDTGIDSAQPPRRYLWTDAFAVCNYLGLHRPDDPREGWISGLPEAEGARHPTAGGLRIGKPLPERKPGEPYDRQLEWERDGQYFHYLTRWMHALDRVWTVTGDPEHHRWAVELADAAVRGFSRASGGERRLQWKMSINLGRALVPSMGQHDPLDGYLTICVLRATAPEKEPGQRDEAGSLLGLELHALREMVQRGRGSWATSDALGAGGLLLDAHRALQLRARGTPDLLEGLPGELLDESLRSVAAVAGSGFRVRSAEARLAFRELGLSIGLAAVERMKRWVPARERPESDGGADKERDGTDDERGRTPSSIDEPRIRALERYLTLRDEFHRFWLDPRSQQAESWTGHEDISRVMLATSLAPDGYLRLEP